MENRRVVLFTLALLCVLAYAPALSLPLFDDDYSLIRQSDSAGITGALTHPVFRVRATSTWLAILLWRTVHLTPAIYHGLSLLFHIANTWLLYAIALAWPRVRPAAFWAAAFFAIAEGHQEAVMWFAAVNELLQFFFGAGALLCLLSGRRVVSLMLFALALLSKESAIVWLVLFVPVLYRGDWRDTARKLMYFVLLGAMAVFSVGVTQRYSFRFSDGSFSLHAPFVMTWIRNVTRVLWIWGWITLALAAWRYRDLLRSLAAPLLWIGAGLLPFIFLTYSRQIPSRQTYLASAGLALLCGIVFERLLREKRSRTLITAVMVAVLVHNLGVLWIRKRAQFVQRAEPTEQLIQLARQTGGPIWVRCFPRPGLIATDAVYLTTPTAVLLWTDAEAAAQRPAAEFCYHDR